MDAVREAIKAICELVIFLVLLPFAEDSQDDIDRQNETYASRHNGWN